MPDSSRAREAWPAGGAGLAGVAPRHVRIGGMKLLHFGMILAAFGLNLGITLG